MKKNNKYIVWGTGVMGRIAMMDLQSKRNST